MRAAVLADPATVLTLPNLITFLRLCAVPVAVWLVVRRDLQWAFWMFLLAGMSDALDGFLARRGARSRLGAVLDPLADKALLTSMYVVLAGIRVLPDWLAILVVFRDVVIVGGVMLMTVLGEPVTFRPLPISKLNTVGQIALVAAALLVAGFRLPFPPGLNWLVWGVAATTLWSGTLYVYTAARQARHTPWP